MIESPALDFWRLSEKPERESYTIDYDFRKIPVKNTGSYWILPYICKFRSKSEPVKQLLVGSLKIFFLIIFK